jgi:hypothetical protein
MINLVVKCCQNVKENFFFVFLVPKLIITEGSTKSDEMQPDDVFLNDEETNSELHNSVNGLKDLKVDEKLMQ